MFSFQSPLFLVLVPFVLAALFYATRRRKSYGHTQVQTQKNLGSWSIWSKIPIITLGSFLILLCLAIAKPVVPEAKSQSTIQTRDLCIAVDISGSMSSEVKDPDQVTATLNATSPTPGITPGNPNRLQVAQYAINLFVPQRKGDRICLMYFDDEAYFGWPLTTDLDVILKRNKRTAKYSGGGTNFEGPIPPYVKMGPIQLAINHFLEMKSARNKVIVMVTDGEDSIHEERFKALLAQMQQYNIKMYVLGVGEGWVTNQEQDLRKLSVASGGKVMVVGNVNDMKTGIEEINKLETSSVVVEKSVTYRDIYPTFLWLAIAAAFAFSLSACFIREDV